MSLKKYLTEAELAAVQPVTGDEFDISIRDLTNIETFVLEHTEGSITIVLDEKAINMLEHCGCTFEEDEEEQIDELAPLIGAVGGALARSAVAGAGALARGAAKAAVGTGIKSAADKLDKKLFGPKPNEGDYEYEEGLNDIRRLSGMNPKETVKEEGHDTSPDGPYDRGAADAYYGRASKPHKVVPYTGADGVKGQMQKVALTEPAEIAAYEAGYREAEFGEKDYGESVMPEGRFEELLTTWRIVSKKNDSVVVSPKFNSKEEAQKYLMTKMFANHQDYKVVNFGSSVMPEGIEDWNMGVTSIPRTEPFKLKNIVVKSPGGKTYTFDTEEDARRLFLDKWNVIKDPKSGWKVDMNNTKPTDESKITKESADIVAQLIIENKLADFLPPFTANGLWVSDRKGNSVLEVTRHGAVAQEVANALNKYVTESINEAEYQGRKVQLGKPMQGDVKKFKVYVKDPSTGNVKKVNFGDPNMRIRKSNPGARKNFRARHNCKNPGPRTKARYWSCRKW